MSDSETIAKLLVGLVVRAGQEAPNEVWRKPRREQHPLEPMREPKDPLTGLFEECIDLLDDDQRAELERSVNRLHNALQRVLS